MVKGWYKGIEARTHEGAKSTKEIYFLRLSSVAATVPPCHFEWSEAKSKNLKTAEICFDFAQHDKEKIREKLKNSNKFKIR